MVLAETVPDILVAIGREERALRDVPWRTLEEIVAELLRSKGLEVTVTNMTRDGGRDIVARGELVPGEPSEIAVSVKQEEVVGIAAARDALYANQDYPLVMLATAGSFSAGVITERRREQVRLRLLLKDGIALRQWIDAYVLHHNRMVGEGGLEPPTSEV